MSNTTKSKDDDYIEAILLNNKFKNASNQIGDADTKIQEAEKFIKEQKKIKLKAEWIINEINWETKLSKIIPIMPKSWKNNPKLLSRYTNLTKVIQNNPKWWMKWKDRIELQDEWIDFKESQFILDLDDLPETQNWDDFKKNNMIDNIPKIDYLKRIKSFIIFAWIENYSLLKDFLGFNDSYYWSSTEYNQDEALKIRFENSIEDDITSKEIKLNIRTIKKY